MTANSFTGTVKTDGDFELIENVTTGSSFTGFTAGNMYTFQVQHTADIKIADAIFTLHNGFMYWKATDDDIYIKTDYSTTNDIGCILTILETVVS